MAPIRSATVAVTSPRSLLRARAWRRRRRTSRWSSTTRSGTKARVKRVSRREIWLNTTSVTATTTRFWKSETSEAVITVLVWSTSAIMAEMTCPARVRWKKPSSSVRRWSKSRMRSSRTRPSCARTVIWLER